LSSKILRSAILEAAPLVIDNELLLSYPTEDTRPRLDDELVEALQYEHPDAEPDEIEDAIQEAMDQFRHTSELEAPFFGLEEDDGEPPTAAFDLQSEPELGIFDEPLVELAVPAPASEALLEEARQSAEEIVESARRESQRILSEADDRAAEIERAAYGKGYDEGVDAGKAAGEERAAEMVRQVVAIVDQASEVHDSMLGEAEAEMVALCLEIARKVIHAELLTNPDVVKGVVEDAVKRINGSPRVTIKVNPGQVDDVQSHWNTAFGAGYREKEWVIEGDTGVEPGGCVLDTRYGSIDARIGTQFSQVQKTFELLLGSDE
jgi:flagellar assembly protein FliH